MFKILCLTPVKHVSNVYEYLCSLGDLLLLEDGSYNEVQSVIKQFVPDVLFVNPNKMKYHLDANLLSGVKIVCTASTGMNHIDVDYCKSNNIKVISLTTEYKVLDKITATAEHAFGLMLSLIRYIPKSFADVKKGNWDCEKFNGRQLSCMSVGVVGYGRLGKMFAKYCHSFGMDVYVYDPFKKSQFVDVRDLCDLFHFSDVVSLHVHVNDSTKGMINNYVLKKRKGVYLINTSRSQIVNEQDIITSLREGYLFGYATDVVSSELSGEVNSDIIKCSDDFNIIVTPHLGGATKESQEIAYNYVVSKLKECINE